MRRFSCIWLFLKTIENLLSRTIFWEQFEGIAEGSRYHLGLVKVSKRVGESRGKTPQNKGWSDNEVLPQTSKDDIKRIICK